MSSFLYAAGQRLRGNWRGSADRGATAVEYSLIITLIAGVIVAAAFALGEATGSLFGSAEDALAAAGMTSSAD